MTKLASTLGALSLLACGPELKFSRVGEAREPRPPYCQVTVYSATPKQPHEELGDISIRYKNSRFLTQFQEVPKVIQPEVCKAGGDAAVARRNEAGIYVSATVLSSEFKKPAAERIEDIR